MPVEARLAAIFWPIWPRFSDASDDHMAIGRHDDIGGPDNGRVDAGFEFLEGIPLDADDIAREIDL